MTKKIIFQDSFLLTGIMCFVGCGATIQSCVDDCLEELKKERLLPENAQLIMDAEPQALGIHRLIITVSCDAENTNFTSINKEMQQKIAERFKKSLPEMYEVIDNLDDNERNELFSANWINIIVNLLAIGAISALSLLLAPSLLLTLGLTLISFAATAFTARNYLINFAQTLFRGHNVFNMNTTVTLGWFLSLVHTLYHAISMPLLAGFPMVFMCFIMPVLLITIINGMDEIKHQILKQSKKMHLKGIKTLFPQMANEYSCYQLSAQDQDLFQQLSTASLEELLATMPADEFFKHIRRIVGDQKTPIVAEPKTALKQGMLIRVKAGSCFPVDCNLLDEETLVDSSLLTGEPQQAKRQLDFIPAGAINLGNDVVVCARTDPYNSTINQLLFRSNRAKEQVAIKPNYKFTYLYAGLIAFGVAASMVAPFALGILTFSLAIQNITGILFAICPCTMAIAHELPNLLTIYQRNKHGIIIRNENLCRETTEIHTVIFDKTGTLTTGESQVESAEGISASLWQRIYLLEKKYGDGHPLAKAITRYYEKKTRHQSVQFKDINDLAKDPDRRGLSALVQGKKIHVGSAEYLKKAGITVPKLNPHKTELGFSSVCIAEDGVFRGAIYIKHEIRKGVLQDLQRLKKEGKRIIMLTGDSAESAYGFNKQNGSLFDLDDICAEQSPKGKEDFIRTEMSKTGSDLHLMSEFPKSLNEYKNSYIFVKNNGAQILYYIRSNEGFEKVKINDFKLLEKKINNLNPNGTKLHLNAEHIAKIITANGGHIRKGVDPKGFAFVGDGLNDGPCAQLMGEYGGTGFSMTSDDKTAFCTDVSLNGSLKYLFEHNRLNQFLKKNILQNQGLLMYSALAFTAFILSFSIAGIAVSPIIPLIVMASTTLMVLFNSYRVPLHVDCVSNNDSSWLKRLLASDVSLGLLVGASLFFMSALLISTIATGGLALPVIAFTAGIATAISSSFILASIVLCFTFITLVGAHLIVDKWHKNPPEDILSPAPSPLEVYPSPERVVHEKKPVSSSLWASADRPDKGLEEEEDYRLSGSSINCY